MPFTYLAHQVPALALKRRWPAAFDGTALALGTMAPDWAYALSGSRFALDGHSLPGLIGFCIPAAIVAALVLRNVAPVLFAYGPRILRPLRALGSRRPAALQTLVAAGLGALTHVAWDLFTHDERWGPRHIGWLRATAPTVLGHTYTWAKVLQYASHILGSVVAGVLLWQLLRGADAGPRAARGTGVFLGVTAVGVLAGGVWALGDPGLPAVLMRLSLGLALGLVAASIACRGLLTERRR